MFDYEQLASRAPFSLGKKEKTALFSDALGALTRFHYDQCEPYRKILDVMDADPAGAVAAETVPFLPVRLFKEMELLSIPKQRVFKTMLSSGTSGQSVSKIFLDQTTAMNQTKTLARIMGDFLGRQRLPMLVVDTKAVLKDRNQFSARGAGILGFSMLGTDVTYALDESMRLDWPTLDAFLARHQGAPILVFGFTFLVWESLVKAVADSGRALDLSTGILVHGGGWKKLETEAVSAGRFKELLENSVGIRRVHNYYGMVEQTGSIFVECERGYLHSSIFSDIVVRRADFSLCGVGEAGLVELVSLLPGSYPGHAILTEDLGVILGEDDCACGRLGKYFHIQGRVKDAELRGCSDVYSGR